MNVFLKLSAVAGLAAALVAPAWAQAGKPVVSCDSLAKVVLPETKITAARTYAEGELVFPEDVQEHTKLPKIPAICRVQATIASSKELDVKADVWLPLTGWNGKLVGATYPGGQKGIQHHELIDGLRQGYAAVMIDGPAMDRWDLAGTNAEKLIDYGYRGLHKITVTGKAMVKAFYGKPAKYALFLGCSEGGREGLNEAHHYPEDYDGVTIGGAGHIFAQINAAQLYPSWLAVRNPEGVLSKGQWKLIHAKGLEACDGLDGVIDGVIENPVECPFQVKSLLCAGAASDGCLTAAQVKFAEMIYKGATNPRTGELIFEPPALGDEDQIMDMATADKPMGAALKLYKSVVFGDDPTWDFKKMDMDKDVEKAIRVVGPALHTEPKDLKAFYARGGKLLVWDGWNDYNSPYHWFQFAKDTEKLLGKAVADKGLKMYFAPGMGHCFGGEGCDSFDKLGALASWVETGKAPERIVAAQYAGDQVVKTHPLCLYPAVAKYKGTGQTNEAANWSCVAPVKTAAPVKK